MYLAFKKEKENKSCDWFLYNPFWKNSVSSPCIFSNQKRKDGKGLLLLYLHAKAKAHPIRLEGIIYSVQSQGLLWRKA